MSFTEINRRSGPRPKVASHYLLETISAAGADKAYIILRRGKWDIPGYFGDGEIAGLNLAYLMMHLPFGVPYTLDQAYPFVKNATVLFGFPDIIFFPPDAYNQLLDRLNKSDADIVLGLFLAHHHEKMDMVKIDRKGAIRSIHIKPRKTSLKYTWIIAVWRPSFTGFMHEYVMAHHQGMKKGRFLEILDGKSELYMGDVIQAAIDDDLDLEAVIFDNGRYLDIGTPEDLLHASAFIHANERMKDDFPATTFRDGSPKKTGGG